MLKLFKNLTRIIRHPSGVLVILAGVLLVAHLRFAPNLFEPLRAETLHDFSLSMTFDPQDTDVSVETFLPITNEHQEIVRESVLSGQLQFDDQSSEAGRNGLWTGEGASEIRYRALISTRRVEYDLDETLQIVEQHPAKMEPYLVAAEGIQLGHPEIEEAWVSIQPEAGRELVPVLRSIYDFTYDEIESAPFKGFTDALTALRLRQASCNGKGRLFVALARRNGIPARLVGGVILNNGSKKTSHQWIEAYVQGQWVPFDPTNGYFATLPENYLRLYTGDEPLFTHTRNINFDYRFRIARTQISPALFRFAEDGGGEATFNAARLLKLTGLTEKMVGVFLMFPLATLITVFLRNIVGLKMFGIFMPMLVAAACVQTGLVLGLLTFAGVVAFSFLGQIWLSRFNLLKIPRLAAIITLCTVLFIVILLAVGQNSTFEFGVLAMFPVVIISFLAERIHKMASDHDWRSITISALGALITIALCFTAFSSVTLQGIFALMPELLLLVLALQIALGQWSGMRLLEYVRFRDILGNGPVLGINQRNRKYINTLNSSELLDLAADKLKSKEMLASSGVPIAPTLSTCDSFRSLDTFLDDISDMTAFALKPNRGSQGNGIVIVTGREGERYVTASGRKLSEMDLVRHTSEILNGSFSQDGTEDQAYVEPLVRQHSSLDELCDLGLADIRVILQHGKPISAMLRLPTAKSGGKANLHQGAIGLAIELETGTVFNATFGGQTMQRHPDTKAQLIGFKMPFWDLILETSINASAAIPLGYIGVDLCIDQTAGPLVLEVNGRPGIEIQNVQKRGLFSEPALGPLKHV